MGLLEDVLRIVNAEFEMYLSDGMTDSDGLPAHKDAVSRIKVEMVAQHQKIVESLHKSHANGDYMDLLWSSGNHNWLPLVWRNFSEISQSDHYEKILLEALTGSRVNNFCLPLDCIKFLIRRADREKLLAAGDPVPGRSPLTLYRGVAGRGSARRVRGVSWTGNIPRAAWFARRLSLPDPAVFQVTVEEKAICAYTNKRQEDEYFLIIPPHVTPRRLRIDLDSIPPPDRADTAHP